MILVDNVLWSGNVINAEVTDQNTLAVRAFNDHVAGDPRVDCVMLAIGDGITFITLRGADRIGHADWPGRSGGTQKDQQ